MAKEKQDQKPVFVTEDKAIHQGAEIGLIMQYPFEVEGN